MPDESEDELGTFLATVTPADLSDWEFRLYQHYRLRAERSNK
jgi:hypothetical protein